MDRHETLRLRCGVCHHPAMGVVRRAVGRTWLALSGWAVEGEPPIGRCVLIAAPHTSNWDFPHTLGVAFTLDLPMRWAGKHTLFRFPFRALMVALGGLPIERHKRSNRVHSLASLFEEHDQLILIMAAEGTRKRVEHWKSGFYRVAQAAQVPIVCAYLDYARKRGGFGLTFTPSGDMRADMDRIRAFYADKIGCHPDQFGPIRLRDEDDA